VRLLVTGAGGMLGHDVAAVAGEDAVALGHAELDVTDFGAVCGAIRAAQPDVVVNCAAWTDVDGAEAHERQAAAVNADGAGNVARAAAEAGASVVHVSTDYVFDGAASSPYLESHPTAPLGAYGRTKLAGERAVAIANPRQHIVRSSWLFGRHGHNFVATMLRLGRERDSITVVSDQVGCPTYTGHLAEAVLEIARSERFGVWHVAGGGEATWNELARAALEHAHLDCEVLPGRTADLDRPAPRPAYSVLASERADAPRLPHWRDGLAAFLSTTAVGAR
jgi:dTDP-4-dehydrorhamnose reductase